jgi:hypothetical protein
MALGSTQPLTEMSTRNIPGGKGRQACGAHKLTAIPELFRKCGRLDVSQPYGPSRSVTGIALPFTFMHTFMNNHTQQSSQSPDHTQNVGYPYFLVTCASYPLH